MPQSTADLDPLNETLTMTPQGTIDSILDEIEPSTDPIELSETKLTVPRKKKKEKDWGAIVGTREKSSRE